MSLLDIHYAEWMMIAGGVLAVIGFFGLAFDQNRNLPPEDHGPVEPGLKAKGT